MDFNHYIYIYIYLDIHHWLLQIDDFIHILHFAAEVVDIYCFIQNILSLDSFIKTRSLPEDVIEGWRPKVEGSK